MTEVKTKRSGDSVNICLQRMEDSQKRSEYYEIYRLIKKLTGEDVKMWGQSMVGFDELMTRLGKYKTGKSSLYKQND
ncbi:MAG: hypothetical protein DRI69_03390 [Bacteroidetes bacterium]|nr:MAG: hypothetical protein DRI69_03390 [Bacteroidota bacterium]